MPVIYCNCAKPLQASNPRHTACLRCCHTIRSDVLSSDSTIRWFFDRLAAAFPGGQPPETFDFFRRQCEDREKAGRTMFGIAYMSRNNPFEAMEEAADAANYFFFDVLQNRQRQNRDDDLDLVLTGAWHAFKLHQVAQELSQKRRGTP